MTSQSERPMKGVFIVLEGPDFCGKGTQHELLCNYLFDHPNDRDKLITVVRTREPSNTHYTQEIRRLLKSGLNIQETGGTLTELYVADRLAHIHSVILPCLAAGNIVVSDRYKYSTLAYQHAQGVPLERLMKLHERMPVPDVVFFLDVPFKERLKRKAIATNRSFVDVFDSSRELQEKLDKNYSLLKTLLPKENMIMIDGNRPPKEVAEDIRKHVDKLIFAEVK